MTEGRLAIANEELHDWLNGQMTTSWHNYRLKQLWQNIYRVSMIYIWEVHDWMNNDNIDMTTWKLILMRDWSIEIYLFYYLFYPFFSFLSTYICVHFCQEEQIVKNFVRQWSLCCFKWNATTTILFSVDETFSTRKKSLLIDIIDMTTWKLILMRDWSIESSFLLFFYPFFSLFINVQVYIGVHFAKRSK